MHCFFNGLRLWLQIFHSIISPGKAYQSYCNSNEDCEWFRDSATGDQNLVCIKDSVSDKYGLCECDKGYVYHTEAELCVDGEYLQLIYSEGQCATK